MEEKDKKPNKISNPLTMIGVFAGLAEAAGAVVLPLIAAAHQKYFIWYVMGFPVLLVCLFFYVLIRHPENLYAPSDYEDETLFVQLQLKATANLMKASCDPNSGRYDPNIDSIPDTVIKAFSNLDTKAPAWKNKILWVDDNPEANTYERNAFENMGFEFSLALSTGQALDLLKNKKFAAIISDMGRKEGDREGYVLLENVRKQGFLMPFFIYSSSDLPEHKEEARQRGAQGSVCYPQELFAAVIDKLRNH